MGGSFTFDDIKTKIENDLDLVEETFITQEELLGYVNEGIRRAEQIVLTIHEDYFLDKQYLSVTSGTSSYSLPSDIYGHKIRKLMYNNGTDIYAVEYIHTKSYKFEEFHVTNQYSASVIYKYTLLNSLASGVKIEFYPTIRDTSSTNFTIWYIRDARTIASVSDTNPIDIPEAFNFIYAYVKKKCLAKENAGLAVPTADAEFEMEKQLLESTLTGRVIDDENKLESDMSHYFESV